MNFNLPDMSGIQAGIDSVNENRQKLINAAQIQAESTAEPIAKHLFQEILRFQQNLPDTEDVLMMLVQFNQSTTILVENIGYIGHTMISFHGKDTNNNPIELIQHISQLNFLLTACKKLEPELPKRKIGFVVED